MTCARNFWLTVALALLTAANTPAQTAADLFNDTVLHEVRLRIAPVDWQKLRDNFLDNTYYPAELTWRGRTLEVGVRSRGLGSRSATKPHLKVDMNRYESNQRFLGLRAIILQNMIQDPTCLRERLSMSLFRRMGLPAPRESPTRLFVNDEPMGLYSIVESIDQDFLQRVYNEDNGYLYDYTYTDAYRFEYRGPDAARYSPLPFQPQTHEDRPDPAPLVEMIRTMTEASNTDFPRVMAEFLDLKLALAHIGLETFIAEPDGILGYDGMNNFYLYRFQGRKLSQFIAWDKGVAMSHPENVLHLPTEGIRYPLFYNTETNVLTRRALTYPDLRSAYMEGIYRGAILAGGAGGWLEREVERMYNQVREAVYQDTKKLSTNTDFENGVTFLREFARERAAFVRSELTTAGYQPAANAPRIFQGGAVNAAGNPGPLAPGSLATIYGERFSAATAEAQALPLPTTLAGASVFVNGIAAPLIYVSPGQINFQIPWETPTGDVAVTAILNNVPGNTLTPRVAPVGPGIFVVVHADNSLVNASSPAVVGEVLVVYATGLGAVVAPVETGVASPASPLPSTTELPIISLAGVAAREVLFSGLTPGLVGLYQVNFRVPPGVGVSAAAALQLTMGGQSASVLISTR